MPIFFFFPDLYIFLSGASSSTRGGVRLLLFPTALAVCPPDGPYRKHRLYWFFYCCARIRCCDTCLLSRYLAADIFFWLNYSGFSAIMSPLMIISLSYTVSQTSLRNKRITQSIRIRKQGDVKSFVQRWSNVLETMGLKAMATCKPQWNKVWIKLSYTTVIIFFR
jgi:hypothetical protein